MLAREMLSVPASSAPAERIFKTLAWVLAHRRCKLKDSLAEKIVFIHENRMYYAPEVWERERQKLKDEDFKYAQDNPDPFDSDSVLLPPLQVIE
jgi:hypothetical protein